MLEFLLILYGTAVAIIRALMVENSVVDGLGLGEQRIRAPWWLKSWALLGWTLSQMTNQPDNVELGLACSLEL